MIKIGDNYKLRDGWLSHPAYKRSKVIIITEIDEEWSNLKIFYKSITHSDCKEWQWENGFHHLYRKVTTE